MTVPCEDFNENNLLMFPEGFIFLLVLLFLVVAVVSNLQSRNGLSLNHNRDYDCKNV